LILKTSSVIILDIQHSHLPGHENPLKSYFRKGGPYSGMMSIQEKSKENSSNVTFLGTKPHNDKNR